jgi:hypothetical protein
LLPLARERLADKLFLPPPPLPLESPAACVMCITKRRLLLRETRRHISV